MSSDFASSTVWSLADVQVSATCVCMRKAVWVPCGANLGAEHVRCHKLQLAWIHWPNISAVMVAVEASEKKTLGKSHLNVEGVVDVAVRLGALHQREDRRRQGLDDLRPGRRRGGQGR